MKYKLILLLVIAAVLAASAGLGSCQMPKAETAQSQTQQATDAETVKVLGVDGENYVIDAYAGA